MKRRIIALLLSLGSFAGYAQGHVNQKGVAPLLATQQGGTAPEPVKWHVYKFPASAKTAKAQLAGLQTHLKSLPGEMEANRLEVVELTNRVTRQYLIQKGAVLVPDNFVADFRAYSPYPAHWQEAAGQSKLFVIDKYTQTFGAYENGNLVRWGLVSTGGDGHETPGGRFAFNWKQETRNSSEAPEGEVWEMRWVYNFYSQKGIHVHQYSLPIAQNASHGCVRLTESDAQWNFNWAEKGTVVLVLNYAPMGLASQWHFAEGETPYSQVMLPPDPMSVPDGTTEGMAIK